MRSDDLRTAALALSRDDRAELAQDLIRSLDETGDMDLETVWLGEITRRAREVADGSVQAVDWEIARERIARRLRDRRNAAQASSRR
jgi:putative addiction module component (TIGR02574 family)